MNRIDVGHLCPKPVDHQLSLEAVGFGLSEILFGQVGKTFLIITSPTGQIVPYS
jgi:hypothetical protein